MHEYRANKYVLSKRTPARRLLTVFNTDKVFSLEPLERSMGLLWLYRTDACVWDATQHRHTTTRRRYQHQQQSHQQCHQLSYSQSAGTL